MKTIFLINYLVMAFSGLIHAQTVYVDSNKGDNKNPGTEELPLFSIEKAVEIIRSRENEIFTIKINPGIYVLNSYVQVSTEKKMTEKRIVIETNILPDDPAWTPEKMPVITCKAMKGDLQVNYNWVVSFLIDENNVTVRGFKFHGYYYPHTRYFPIARINKSRSDLIVEQCLFVADPNISQIQAGIIAHGNKVKIDHCIFYKVRNTVVFFQDSGDGIKSGNSVTNSIIYGASQAVWTSSPDKDFIFENNIVSDCRYVWAKSYFNTSGCYSIDNCVIVNNQYLTGIADSLRLSPGKFEIRENNVIKNGEVTLRLTGNNAEPFLDEVDKPLPIDYMHVIPGSPGYNMGAGLFRNKKM